MIFHNANALVLAMLVALAGGCEEVLEVCADCGLVSKGDTAISGDPQLDGTLEAVHRISLQSSEATGSLENVLSELAVEYGVGLIDPDKVGPLDATSVVEAINTQLLAIPGASFSIYNDKPACWVNSELALSRQRFCEEKIDCFVDLECASTQEGSCTGLCEGECSSGCDGICLETTSTAGEDCLISCMGTCEDTSTQACRGMCLGTCDGPCGGYSSTGECSGHCDGLCTGVCESDLLFDCTGTCDGMCRVPLGVSEGLEVCAGRCMGDCSEGQCLSKQCRGHFRPEGCDLPERCDGVYGCQEMARFIAWAYASCEAGRSHVSVDFASAFTGDRSLVTRRTVQLERALTRIVTYHAWLSLLIDGIDVTAEITADALFEAPDSASPHLVTDSVKLKSLGVAESRRSLPMSALKARTGFLVDTAASGAYQIAAGPTPCVAPAFEDAKEIMDALIPTTEGEEGELVADRLNGLFLVLDGMDALLNISSGDGS